MATNLLDNLRTKYPEYKDIPDVTLWNKLVDKYPQYEKQREDFYGTISEPSPKSVSAESLRGQFRNGWVNGVKSLEMGNGWWNALTGVSSVEDEILNDTKREPVQNIKTNDLGQDVANSLGSMLPFMLNASLSALKAGGVGASAGVVAGSVGGPLMPLTSAAGAAAGFVAGGTVGMIDYTMKVMGGNTYRDLSREGVEGSIAKPIAIAAGLAQGVIATTQIGLIARDLPGGTQLLSKKLTDLVVSNPTIKSTLLSHATKFGIGVGEQAMLSTSMEAVNLSSEYVGNLINGLRYDADYKGPTAQDAIDRITGSVKSAILGFPLVILPGHMYSMVRDITNIKGGVIKEPLVVTKQELSEVQTGVLPQSVKDKIANYTEVNGVKPEIATLDVTPIQASKDISIIEQVNQSPLNAEITKLEQVRQLQTDHDIRRTVQDTQDTKRLLIQGLVDKPEPIVPEPPKVSDKLNPTVIAQGLKQSRDLRDSIIRKFDIEYGYTQEGAPKTGLNVKNQFSKVAAGQERAKIAVLDLGKLNLKQEEYSLMARVGEQERLLPKDHPNYEKIKAGAKYINDKYNEYYVKLKAAQPEIFKYPWPESKIERNNAEIKALGELLKGTELTLTAPDEVKSLQLRIHDLLEENKFFVDNNVQYAHIPLRLWLNKVFDTDPVKAKKLMTGSGLFKNIVGRKSLTIDDIVNSGLVKPQDVDAREMLAHYISYAEEQLGLNDILQNAVAEGVAKPKGKTATEGWVSLPNKLSPVFSKYEMSPGIATLLEQYFETSGKDNFGWGDKVLSWSKLFQFYNPLKLAVNNTTQGIMLGALTPSLPKNLFNAIKSVATKDEAYWTNYHNGGFSSPFADPYRTFQKDIKDIMAKQNDGSIMLHTLNQLSEYKTQPWKVVSDVYSLSFDVAWTLERVTRMIGYNHMLEKGLSPEQASQVSSKFFGDYASVPAKTRKEMNRILFTPTYELCMGKLYSDMLKGAATKATYNGKYSSSRAYAEGLLWSSALLVGKNMYLTKGLGFRCDEFSRKYSKTIDTDMGPKDVGLTYSDPSNIWLRYYYGLKPGELDTNLTDRGVKFLQNKLNPTWRILAMLHTNTDEQGKPIYNVFDPGLKGAADVMRFTTTRFVRATENFDTQSMDNKKKVFDALKEATGTINATFLNQFIFAYTKKSSLEGFESKAQQFAVDAAKYTDLDEEAFIGMNEQQQENYIRQYQLRIFEYQRKLLTYYQKGPKE